MSLYYQKYLYKTIDSTNSEAFRLIDTGFKPPFIIVAEEQMIGRGRLGSKWVSPARQNLYYSLARPLEKIDGLSLVIGLSVLKVLRRFGIINLGLKWPNDILVGRKKIAGILVESRILNNTDKAVAVVGVGINVNMSKNIKIDQPWTSMLLEKSLHTDINQIIEILTSTLHNDLLEYSISGFPFFRKEWEDNHTWVNSEVFLTSSNTSVCGTIIGVTSRGELCLDIDGSVEIFSSGALKLRLGNDS